MVHTEEQSIKLTLNRDPILGSRFDLLGVHFLVIGLDHLVRLAQVDPQLQSVGVHRSRHLWVDHPTSGCHPLNSAGGQLATVTREILQQGILCERDGSVQLTLLERTSSDYLLFILKLYIFLFNKITYLNVTAHCKELFEYKHLFLLRDIWWSKLYSIFKCCSFFQHQYKLAIVEV